MFRKVAFTVTLLMSLAGVAGANEPLRDPMRPAYSETETPASSATSARKFSVSAIFVSKSRRIAVLNGETVTIGDQVDGATVTAIDDQKVSFVYGGQRLSAELKLPRIRE